MGLGEAPCYGLRAGEVIASVMSEGHGLMWRCAGCAGYSYLHYENCAHCGRARPKPAPEPKPKEVEPPFNGS